jgi:hypothetical protein
MPPKSKAASFSFSVNSLGPLLCSGVTGLARGCCAGSGAFDVDSLLVLVGSGTEAAA